MTVSRTNLVTNPHATTTTGWSYQLGSGESSTVAASTGTDTPDGRAGYLRATITTPKTGGNSGHYRNQAVTAGVAGDMYTGSVYVRCSITTSFSLSATCRSVSTPVGSYNSGSVLVPANTWTRLNATVTATGAYDNVQVWGRCESASIVPASGTIDVTEMLLTTGSGLAAYFDGSTAPQSNKTYAWTSTVDASTSNETIGLPTTTCQGMVDAPCPRVGVTVDGLGTGTTVYNLWRTADGVRKVVRGARNRSTVDSDYVIDYEAPLGRTITYDIEVVSGTNYLAATFPDTATVTSSTWWIQDPLVPASAIPLAVNHQDTTIPTLTAAAVKALAYAADVNIIPILGSSEPVALMGTRQLASGVDFSMFTRAAEATTTLRNLIQQTPLLLVRTNGVRNDGVPALAYFASAKPVEQPVTVAYGGTLTNWQLQGDLVAAPSLNVLIPIWTYGNVQNLWDTYQQAQTTLAGKLYLDALKSPTGA